MTTTTYTIKGMTCGHCVSAVSGELGQLAGVRDVQVDLGAGWIIWLLLKRRNAREENDAETELSPAS